MKVPKLPKNIKAHPNVWRAVKEIEILDTQMAGKIIQRITELGYDPEPNNEECNSKIVQNLKTHKIYIRRLRCIDIADYRIFYAVRKTGMVCGYAVVSARTNKQHDEAYKEDSHHYKLIKLLYTQWKEC